MPRNSDIGKIGISDYKIEDQLIRIDTTEVVSGFYQFASFTRAKIEEYLSNACQDLEDYMKTNHRWQNRTGQAEAGLYADFYEEDLSGSDYIPVTLGITLGHGVYYGQYLEQSFEGNYAILEPTARLEGPKVFAGMQGLLDRLAR